MGPGASTGGAPVQPCDPLVNRGSAERFVPLTGDMGSLGPSAPSRLWARRTPGPSQGRQGTSSALFTFLCLQSRAERLGRKCRLSGGQPSLSRGPSPLAGGKASAGQPGPGRAGQTEGQAQEGLGQTDGWHSLGRVLSPLGWAAARGGGDFLGVLRGAALLLVKIILRKLTLDARPTRPRGVAGGGRPGCPPCWALAGW